MQAIYWSFNTSHHILFARSSDNATEHLRANLQCGIITLCRHQLNCTDSYIHSYSFNENLIFQMLNNVCVQQNWSGFCRCNNFTARRSWVWFLPRVGDLFCVEPVWVSAWYSGFPPHSKQIEIRLLVEVNLSQGMSVCVNVFICMSALWWNGDWSSMLLHLLLWLQV